MRRLLTRAYDWLAVAWLVTAIHFFPRMPWRGHKTLIPAELLAQVRSTGEQMGVDPTALETEIARLALVYEAVRPTGAHRR